MIYTSDLEKLEFIQNTLIDVINRETTYDKLNRSLMYIRDLQQPHLRSHDYLIRKKSHKVDPKIKQRTAELFNFKQELK